MSIDEQRQQLRLRIAEAARRLESVQLLTQYACCLECAADAEGAERLAAEPRGTEAEARAWLDAHALESGI